jgi:hypothetical protein
MQMVALLFRCAIALEFGNHNHDADVGVYLHMEYYVFIPWLVQSGELFEALPNSMIYV